MRLSTTILLIVLPFTAPAHHPTAEYDRTAVDEIEDEVIAVNWRNPHVSYELRTLGPGGRD
jgi:hypothetical protein